MIVQKRYRESVSPDPAVESGLLAMVDGLYIVLEHAKRYDTLRALWTAVLVAAVTSQKARDRFAHTDDLKDALRPSQAAWWPPIHDGRTVPCTECARQQSDRCASSGRASQHAQHFAQSRSRRRC